MSLNGSAIIAKKRALDPELRENLNELRRQVRQNSEKRGRWLEEKKDLIEEVIAIKERSLGDLDEHIYAAAKKISKSGINVFLAKKPIDLAEYIREVIGKKTVGVVPSPQTMESEVMQAFFMSNKVSILSKKYAAHEKGLAFTHPYIPYPTQANLETEDLAKKYKDADFAILSAIVVTDNGNAYFEEDEIAAMRNFDEPFVIVTADRIFSEADADCVEHLMELSSGGLIKAEKTNIKGHLIILDNNRLSLARNGMAEALRCINCYYCSIECPSFLSVGGLFGSPAMAGIGAISSSYQSGIKAGVSKGLYYCNLCRRCEELCPVNVPVTELIKKLRKKARISGH